MRTLRYGIFAAAVAAVALSTPVGAQPYGGGYGPGWMMGGGFGPGWMMGPGYGPGMMGGYGPGMMGGYGPGWMMGQGYYGQQANINISIDQVKTYLGRMLAIRGNPRLKVGDVKEKDADTIIADIVTKDKDALVQRFAVDRHTGIFRPVED